MQTLIRWRFIFEYLDHVSVPLMLLNGYVSMAWFVCVMWMDQSLAGSLRKLIALPGQYGAHLHYPENDEGLWLTLEQVTKLGMFSYIPDSRTDSSLQKLLVMSRASQFGTEIGGKDS